MPISARQPKPYPDEPCVSQPCIVLERGPPAQPGGGVAAEAHRITVVGGAQRAGSRELQRAPAKDRNLTWEHRDC